MKPIKKKSIPMYYKIMLAFLALGILQMIIMVIGSAITQKNAEVYLENRIIEKYEAATNEIMSVLETNGWKIDDNAFIAYFEGYAFRHDIRLEILDANHRLVFTNIGEPTVLGEPTTRPPDNNRDNPLMRSGFPVVVDEIDIIVNEEKVGLALVEYFEVIRPNDVSFFDRMGDVFRYTMIATFIMTLFVSFFVARSITVPLKKVSNTAKRISTGNLDARAEVQSSTSEILELSESINNLGITLTREDALRKQVTSDMAHEIRTPLTALRNFFEAFIDGIYEPNESNMMKCHDEVLRMSDLVDRLKDLATIEAANISSTSEKVNLSEEISTMCDFLKPEYFKKSMSLSYRADESIELYINRNHLRQIISNLLTNANRYSDEGTHVQVMAVNANNQAVITVKDEGIGMSMDDCENIFERFYRADKSRDRATGGMGVGLTIVKTLVESYKGTITVQSELGVGTTFKVVLPIKK